MSLRNVTLDASANSTQLSYTPTLCTGAGWVLNTTKGSDLAYRSCTTQGNDGLSVNLTFTGVAIYYQSPFFDGLSLRFTLDGSPSSDINITGPHTSDPSSTPAVTTMWQQVGLQNKTHVLQLTPGAGIKTLNIGSFIITESTPPPVNATSLSPLAQAAALAGPTQSESTTRFGIGFGAAFGALAFIIFLWISWTLAQRRVEKKKYYDWPQDHRIIPDDREIEFDRTAFSQNSQIGPQSPVLQDGGVASHPIPGRYTSQESLSVDGRNRAPTASDHGVASPVHSNTVLLPQRAESSQGHTAYSGPAPSYSAYPPRLEPVRASPHSSLAPSPTSYTSANRYANPHVYSPQNRPIPLLSRTPADVNVTRSITVPASAVAAPLPDTLSSSLSRGSTFSSKLEPVRRQRT